MKEKPEFRWIQADDCDQPLTISGFVKTGNEKLLLLVTNKKDLVQMSLYGKNWNYLVFAEEDSDKWTGKTIFIKDELKEGKHFRTITKVM